MSFEGRIRPAPPSTWVYPADQTPVTVIGGNPLGDGSDSTYVAHTKNTEDNGSNFVYIKMEKPEWNHSNATIYGTLGFNLRVGGVFTVGSGMDYYTRVSLQDTIANDYTSSDFIADTSSFVLWDNSFHSYPDEGEFAYEAFAFYRDDWFDRIFDPDGPDIWLILYPYVNMPSPDQFSMAFSVSVSDFSLRYTYDPLPPPPPSSWAVNSIQFGTVPS